MSELERSKITRYGPMSRLERLPVCRSKSDWEKSLPQEPRLLKEGDMVHGIEMKNRNVRYFYNPSLGFIAFFRQRGRLSQRDVEFIEAELFVSACEDNMPFVEDKIFSDITQHARQSLEKVRETL